MAYYKKNFCGMILQKDRCSLEANYSILYMYQYVIWRYFAEPYIVFYA